jgi:hypothetical protein
MPASALRRRNGTGWGALLVLVLGGGSLARVIAESPEPTRLRPPERVSCARDHLTSCAGRVLAYAREPGRISLRVATDWNTTETVRLVAPDPVPHLLLRGEPFRAADWDAIESAPGKLRPGVRVIAWVCDDGRPPVIDWRPPSQERR